MIVCIPARESKGLDSAFEPDFGSAVSMVIYNADTHEVRDVQVNTSNHAPGTPAGFEAVLCGRIEREIWTGYLYQGVRFFGMSPSTVGEAIDKFRRGDISTVNVFTSGMQNRKETLPVGGGCGCGCGGHRPASWDHVCCGGKGHGHGSGACGGHGRKSEGCGCG